MFTTKGADLFTLQSQFTRSHGYTNIQSSRKVKHRQAIQILNSFTPQGASPKVSLRIGNWDNKLGLGYYFMENDSNAQISALLVEKSENSRGNLRIPLSEVAIEHIATGSYEKIFSSDIVRSQNLVRDFGLEQTSMILYSILTGDNIIIIHPEHRKRVEFIKSIIDIVPPRYFQYNRITTGCSELDGNENIIGVEKLPKKYRSHKKLYMPVDTIFVDLVDIQIMGEGLKSNQFTTQLGQQHTKDPELCTTQLQRYFDDITKESYSDTGKYGKNSDILTRKIRAKLGLEESNNENWLMSF